MHFSPPPLLFLLHYFLLLISVVFHRPMATRGSFEAVALVAAATSSEAREREREREREKSDDAFRLFSHQGDFSSFFFHKKNNRMIFYMRRCLSACIFENSMFMNFHFN